MNDLDSVAVRILRVAEDLSQVRYLAELDHSVRQLREIARELQGARRQRTGIHSHGTD